MLLKSPLSMRPVADGDKIFLRELFSATSTELAALALEKSHLDQLIETQFAAQREQYRRVYPKATHCLILLDGRAIGQLYIDQDAEVVTLIDISVQPCFQGQGWGTKVIESVLVSASANTKNVQLHVMLNNPAKRLYERLGFVEQDRDAIRARMVWRQKKPAGERV